LLRYGTYKTVNGTYKTGTYETVTNMAHIRQSSFFKKAEGKEAGEESGKALVEMAALLAAVRDTAVVRKYKKVKADIRQSRQI